MKNIKGILKKHAHHVIFGITLLSLAALLAWWSVFIHGSIQDQRIDRLDNLELRLSYFALKLKLDGDNPPPFGTLEEDDRFEVGLCDSFDQRFVERLDPSWPRLCLRVAPAVLEEIEGHSRSLTFMLIGESGLFLLIVIVTFIFLYRFIQLERRTAQEVKYFWERSAHELKTPITGIKAFLQNLKDRTYKTENLLPYVDMALAQVEKQEQLAENLLSGYQLKSQGRSSNLQTVELTAYLRRYFNETALHLTDARIDWSLEEDKDVMVRADVYRLGVILDNIVDNALKFCSPELVLQVGVRVEKRKAVVFIKDNGPGFPSQLKDNIFRAYKHLSPELPGGKHGAGIGLYISRQLAKSMGGNLRAKSGGPGQGAEFLLALDRMS